MVLLADLCTQGGRVLTLEFQRETDFHHTVSVPTALLARTIQTFTKSN